MRTRWAHLLAVCCLAAGAGAAFAGAAAPPAPVPTQLARVALFKNGFGFFVREAALPASPHLVLVGPFAAPVHGTFWVSAPASAGFESVIAREVHVKGKPVDAREIGDLLRANVGKRVEVRFTEPSQGAPRVVRGVIIGFAPDRPPVPEPLPAYRMGPGTNQSQIIPWGRGEWVLIRDESAPSPPGAVTAFNAYTAAQITFGGGETVSTQYQADVPGAELEVQLRSPRAGDRLGVTYLARGITWAPSYLIDISDAKTARLTAKALIVNEAEDLAETHVDLITGFPNLQFANVTSPIAQKTDLATFLQQLTGGPYAAIEGATANVLSQAVMYRAAAPAGPPGLPPVSYGAAAVGQDTGDLFFYPVEHVTLKAGETGYYPLFSESVPYTEFYQWTIPDYINASDVYTQMQTMAARPEVVWHSLRLTNTTRVPWTTAPAETVKDAQIMGQDTLNYTPLKGVSTVRVTQAVNVKAEQNEVEAARQREAVRLYGDTFDRVSIDGTLSITNLSNKTVSLEIEKTLSGDVSASQPPAKITTLASGLKRMNPTRKLTWTITLTPGQAQQITYSYQALVRR